MEFWIFVGVLAFVVVVVRAYRSGQRESEGREGPGKTTAASSTGRPVRFEIRYRDSLQRIEGRSFPCKEVEVRGRLPNARTRDLDLKIVLLDVTDGEQRPVLAHLEAFQLKDSLLFGFTTNLGRVNHDQYLPEWTSVGKIFPDFLETPYGGNRRIQALAVLLDHHESDAFPSRASDLDLAWSDESVFPLTVESEGYLGGEERNNRHRVQIVHLAVAVAAADGTIADAEGNRIREWIERQVEAALEGSREELKRKFNQAFRAAYQRTRTSQDLPESVLADLHEEASDSLKYEAMELCYDIMAADGIADKKELRLLDRIARALGLDPDEVQAIRDLRMVGLDTQEKTRDDLESLLGIDPDGSPEEIQRHLRKEFRKWNARVTQASSPEEKQHAQQMIDRIARAREKYARAGS
jgi:tellurite resistance protein